jgi:hypothetical protein
MYDTKRILLTVTLRAGTPVPKASFRALANLEFQKCFKGPPLKSRGAFDGDIKKFLG